MARVVFVGELYNADLSVGGGPIIPAPQPPLGIWGPTDPRPSHPIAGYPWPQPPSGGGPVDPGYSPPWARPWPPYPDNALPGGQPYPDNSLPGYQPRPDHSLPPFATQLPIIPPQQPQPVPGDPSKAYLVAYVPKADGSGHERITFTVEYPLPSEPPTEATPKG